MADDLKRKLQAAGKTEFVFAFEWARKHGQVSSDQILKTAKKQERHITRVSANIKAHAINKIFSNGWEIECLQRCFHIIGGNLQKKAEKLARRLVRKYFSPTNKKQKETPICEITCTFAAFHKFIGPRIRNVIQTMTKKRKNALHQICQQCHKTRELQAAHRHGNGRKQIIDKILDRYDENGIIKANLENLEMKIIKAHQPIDKYFLFLCAECHKKYDHDAK